MTTQLCVVSTYFGAMTVAAALDAGLLDSGTDRPAERILVITNNAVIPESVPAFDEAPGIETVIARFDRVLSWNETIAPLHPRQVGFAPNDRILAERLLRSHWDLGSDPVEVVAESIHIRPSRAIAEIFSTAPILVYSDGLMSYGPTRDPLPPDLGGRVDRLLHLDLVPGVKPLLLEEFSVESVVIPDTRFESVLVEVSKQPDVHRIEGVAAGSRALILGQYMSALEILTPAEEERLHVAMLDGVAAKGMSDVVFKPHPTAPAGINRSLEKRASELGVRFEIRPDPIPFEAMTVDAPPDLVVACFSTGLATARRFMGCDVAHMGTERLLRELDPYANSNRIPLTIVDATTPDLGSGLDTAFIPEGETERLSDLLGTVSFLMQPESLQDRRDAAARYIAHIDDPRLDRYFASAPMGELEAGPSRWERLAETNRLAFQVQRASDLLSRSTKVALARERFREKIRGRK